MGAVVGVEQVLWGQAVCRCVFEMGPGKTRDSMPNLDEPNQSPNQSQLCVLSPKSIWKLFRWTNQTTAENSNKDLSLTKGEAYVHRKKRHVFKSKYSLLTVWCVEPVVAHRTSWPECTGVSTKQCTTVSWRHHLEHVQHSLHVLHWCRQCWSWSQWWQLASSTPGDQRLQNEHWRHQASLLPRPECCCQLTKLNLGKQKFSLLQARWLNWVQSKSQNVCWYNSVVASSWWAGKH